MDKALKAMKRRLERLELEHLRQHALELHQRLEQAESEAQRAIESADFWQRHAMELQEELYEEKPGANCIGLTKEGELLVIKTSSDSTTRHN